MSRLGRPVSEAKTGLAVGAAGSPAAMYCPPRSRSPASVSAGSAGAFPAMLAPDRVRSAKGEKTAVGGEGVVDRRRVGVFRGEAVVDGDHSHPGPARDLGGQPEGGLRGAHHVGTAVEVQDGPGRVRPLDLHGDRGNPAELPGTGAHVRRQRVRGGHLLEHLALLGQVRGKVQRAVPQDSVQDLTLLF